VPSEAHRQVGLASAIPQGPRHGLEGQITGAMSVAVVDGLQAVHVREEQRQRLPIPSRARRLLLEPLLESQRIAQPGEGVRTGKANESIGLASQSVAEG